MPVPKPLRYDHIIERTDGSEDKISVLLIALSDGWSWIVEASSRKKNADRLLGWYPHGWMSDHLQRGCKSGGNVFERATKEEVSRAIQLQYDQIKPKFEFFNAPR